MQCILEFIFFFSTELMFSFQLSLLSKTSPKYFMGTCRAPQIELSPKRFTMAAMALFSASKQTHFIQFVCDSEWVTVALHSFFFFFFLLFLSFFNIHRSGYSAVWLLHGWCHVRGNTVQLAGRWNPITNKTSALGILQPTMFFDYDIATVVFRSTYSCAKIMPMKDLTSLSTTHTCHF